MTIPIAVVSEDSAAFFAAVHAVEKAGLIAHVEELDTDVYSAVPGPHGFPAAAREFARLIPRGSFVPARGGQGLRWGIGPLQGGLIVHPSCLPNVKKAQEFTREIIPKDARPAVAWTVGKNASNCIKWAAGKVKPNRYAETLLPTIDDEREFCFHSCQPGRYEYAYHYDANSYYHTLLERAKSWRLSFGRNGMVFDNWSAEEKARVGAFMRLAATEDFSPVRYAVWGVMLGSYEWRDSFTSAKSPGIVHKKGVRYGAGLFRPMALLVARTAAELCSLAAIDTGSVYSTVDSVTTLTPEPPAVWGQWDIPSRVKWEGPSHIIGKGCWKIGEKETEPYKKGWHEVREVPIKPFNEFFHQEWLRLDNRSVWRV